MAQQTLPKVSTLGVISERCDLICPSLPLLSRSERRGLHGSADTSRWKAWARGTLFFSISIWPCCTQHLGPPHSAWLRLTLAGSHKGNGKVPWDRKACLVASYLDLKQLNRYHSHCCWNRPFTSLRLVRLAESNFGGCVLRRSHLSLAYIIEVVSFKKSTGNTIDFYSVWGVKSCNCFFTFQSNGYFSQMRPPKWCMCPKKCNLKRTQPPKWDTAILSR